MTILSLLTTLLIIVLGIVYYVFKMRSNGLRKSIFQYPACFNELPIIGSLHHLVGDTEHAKDIILEAGNSTIKLGGISRIQGINYYYLVFTNPQDVAEVLSVYKNKDYIYSYFHLVAGNASVFGLDHTVSKIRRQATLLGLSTKMLDSYVPMLVEESVSLTDTLAQFVEKEDFFAEAYLTAFSFFCISKFANVGELREEFCMKEIYSVYSRTLKIVTERVFSYWAHPDFLFKLSNEYREIKQINKTVLKMSSRVLELRSNKLAKKESMRKAKEVNEETGNITDNSLIDGFFKSKLTHKEICEEIVILFCASEESSLAIGYVLVLLGQYPAVQDKVYEELKSIFGDTERALVKDDISEMHYLDLVIKETLRLFPSIPLIFRKADKEIKLSSGRVVPEGAGVAVPIISVLRNPKYWGPDAEHFDPDRFLPERLKGVHENAYMAFSYGSRRCPAYKLAMLMIKTCLSTVLRKYKIVDEPASSPVPDIKTKIELSLKPVNNFKMKLVKRI